MASILRLNFDIDDYLDRIVPSPPWRFVPYPIAYFLGYRRQPPERKHGNVIQLIKALVGIFASLVLIQVVSHQIPWVANHGPRIVASFGATAVLEFYAVESPLAQPRNAFFSQVIGAVVGVAYCKLFDLRPDQDWARWMGGALACATTTIVMGLTKTVHPPAGATALLAVIDDTAAGLGWRLIPLVALGCVIMLFIALIVNNIYGMFPLYWWTAKNLSPSRMTTQTGDSSTTLDEESGEAEKSLQLEITILPGQCIIPSHVHLSLEERLVLEKISHRLQTGVFPAIRGLRGD